MQDQTAPMLSTISPSTGSIVFCCILLHTLMQQCMASHLPAAAAPAALQPQPPALLLLLLQVGAWCTQYKCPWPAKVSAAYISAGCMSSTRIHCTPVEHYQSFHLLSCLIVTCPGATTHGTHLQQRLQLPRTTSRQHCCCCGLLPPALCF
jgi:hypothetical protein